MGFDEGHMVLDSPNGTYYSGQAVNGKLVFHQDKVKSFRGKPIQNNNYVRMLC